MSIVSMSTARRMAVFGKALLGTDEKRKGDESDAADCRRHRGRLKSMGSGKTSTSGEASSSGGGGRWSRAALDGGG